MPLEVDIQVAPQFEPLVDSELLRRAVVTTLENQGMKPDEQAEVVLVVTDDDGIQQLNREFRKIDAPTDVLSFPGTLDADFVTPEGYSGYLGDVVVSFATAAAQAQAAGHPVTREMQLLTIHGVLHLMGLDDEDEEGYQRMVATQDEILAALAPAS
jgi:probable rRNA maturation factor